MSEINNDLKEDAIVTEEVIEAPEAPVAEKVEEAPVVEAPVEAPVVEEKPKAKKAEKASGNAVETVALFSKTNVTWAEVGKLSAGYNIVSKADADKWLTIKNVRVATPEEIATKVAK